MEQRRDVERLQGRGGEARSVSPRRGRRGRGAPGRGWHGRRGLPGTVPGPRLHGADELHCACVGRPVRDLGAHAVPARGAAGGGAGHRVAGLLHHGARHVLGRRLRAAGRTGGLRPGSRRAGAAAGYAGAGGVDARRRHSERGLYRPATYTVLRAGLDAGGRPVAWSHRLVGPDGASFMITRGADELIYAIPNSRLERVVQDPGIPIAPWRGVGPSQNGWVVESFVDELAHAAGQDAVAFRRALVAGKRRLVAVLGPAAQEAGWGSPAPKGRGRGIALWQFGETSVCEVGEVSVGTGGGVRGHRVGCAAGC